MAAINNYNSRNSASGVMPPFSASAAGQADPAPPPQPSGAPPPYSTHYTGGEPGPPLPDDNNGYTAVQNMSYPCLDAQQLPPNYEANGYPPAWPNASAAQYSASQHAPSEPSLPPPLPEDDSGAPPPLPPPEDAPPPLPPPTEGVSPWGDAAAGSAQQQTAYLPHPSLQYAVPPEQARPRNRTLE